MIIIIFCNYSLLILQYDYISNTSGRLGTCHTGILNGTVVGVQFSKYGSNQSADSVNGEVSGDAMVTPVGHIQRAALMSIPAD